MNLTLLQLNNIVRNAIEDNLRQNYWVEAELSECRVSGGHCYMELVEKDEYSNTPVARARACCWRNVWMKVQPRFERVTGETLHAGMRVLLMVRPQFHEAYGFSWIVNDIDPNYTIGDMARRRQEIIQTLKKEGVFDLNKSLRVPMFAQRIAVISSATAAGYGDFCNQLIDNDYGFQFRTRLFQAVMQGEQVEESVIAALDMINQQIDDFDVVVIIRGGGGTSDFSGFDTLELAENVANFPLPVIVGIGHDRDESILDLIACVSVKTPTAAAAYLIGNLQDTLSRIEDASDRIVNAVRARIETEKMRMARIQSFLPVAFSLKKVREDNRLQHLSSRMQSVISQVLTLERHKVDALEERLPHVVTSRLERENYRLEMLEQRTNALDPIHILRRGYSIALHDGVAVRNPQQLKEGDELSIVMADGMVNAVVKNHPQKNHPPKTHPLPLP